MVPINVEGHFVIMKLSFIQPHIEIMYDNRKHQKRTLID